MHFIKDLFPILLNAFLIMRIYIVLNEFFVGYVHQHSFTVLLEISNIFKGITAVMYILWHRKSENKMKHFS